jgi:serine phosphatase RsbU (regulator of sigma subunit)
LRAALEQEKLAAAMMAGELAAAFRIQMGILPKPGDLTPDPRFNLDAQLVPAKHVGGDLYDFFKIDRDHLFVAIGDVSGKGVPASLFMAVGKALCKSCALREELDIGAIMQRANAEISRDNNEMLFITLFAGVLDLRSGLLSFCNAGHDPPFLVTPGEAPRQVTTIGGPPLCVMDDFPYASEAFQMAPGEILCLVTDGVTEAMNSDGTLMGHERVVSALAGLPPDGDAAGLAAGLHAAVTAFVAGADPSDDLTLLAVQWVGEEDASRSR